MGQKKKPKVQTAFVAIRGQAGTDDWTWFAGMMLASGELTDERLDQVKKYTIEHDDKHSVEDWAQLIHDRAETLLFNSDSKKLTRKYLKQVGAMCIAAIEAMNRKEQKRGRRTG
jgi:hypothetical protein